MNKLINIKIKDNAVIIDKQINYNKFISKFELFKESQTPKNLLSLKDFKDEIKNIKNGDLYIYLKNDLIEEEEEKGEEKKEKNLKKEKTVKSVKSVKSVKKEKTVKSVKTEVIVILDYKKNKTVSKFIFDYLLSDDYINYEDVYTTIESRNIALMNSISYKIPKNPYLLLKLLNFCKKYKINEMINVIMGKNAKYINNVFD